MIKISIIIPIYNSEKYIKECLDSLVNQSLSDIEIICVNDGSTDNTLFILNKFAQNDSRVKIISQENSGQGKARNIGIDVAKGEYISFIDSDDFVDKDFCLKMYNRAHEDATDITMCCVQLFDNQNNCNLPDEEICLLKPFVNEFEDKCFSFEDTKQYYFDRIYGIAANKIFRTAFLKENNLKFPENIKAEDYLFFYNYWIKVERANICYEKLYYYRKNNVSSDTSTAVTTYGYCFLEHFRSIEKIIKNAGYWEELRIPFLDKKISGIDYWYNRTTKNFQPEFYKMITEEYKRMDLDRTTLDQINYDNKRLYLDIKNNLYYFMKFNREILKKYFTIKFERKDNYLWLQFFSIKTKIKIK